MLTQFTQTLCISSQLTPPGSGAGLCNKASPCSMLTGSGCYPPSITGPQRGQKAQTEGPPSSGRWLLWSTRKLGTHQPVVEGRRGVCTVIKSQRGQICSRGSCCTPKDAETSGEMTGS